VHTSYRNLNDANRFGIKQPIDAGMLNIGGLLSINLLWAQPKFTRFAATKYKDVQRS
jgi:hypothetical protein